MLVTVAVKIRPALITRECCCKWSRNGGKEYYYSVSGRIRQRVEEGLASSRMSRAGEYVAVFIRRQAMNSEKRHNSHEPETGNFRASIFGCQSLGQPPLEPSKIRVLKVAKGTSNLWLLPYYQTDRSEQSEH